MSVYVDAITEYDITQVAPAARKFGTRWTHMIADTLRELHIMADKIGLKKEWFQNKRIPHYDLVPSKRILAIKYGALEIEDHEQLRDILERMERTKIPRIGDAKSKFDF